MENFYKKKEEFSNTYIGKEVNEISFVDISNYDFKCNWNYLWTQKIFILEVGYSNTDWFHIYYPRWFYGNIYGE